MTEKVIVIEGSDTTQIESDVDVIEETVDNLQEQVADIVETAVEAKTIGEENSAWLERATENFNLTLATLTDKVASLELRISEMTTQTLRSEETDTLTLPTLSETISPETIAETSSSSETEAPHESVAENPPEEAPQVLLSIGKRQILKI